MNIGALRDSSLGFYLGMWERCSSCWPPEAGLDKQSFLLGNHGGALIPLSQSTLVFNRGSMNQELLWLMPIVTANRPDQSWTWFCKRERSVLQENTYKSDFISLSIREDFLTTANICCVALKSFPVVVFQSLRSSAGCTRSHRELVGILCCTLWLPHVSQPPVFPSFSGIPTKYVWNWVWHMQWKGVRTRLCFHENKCSVMKWR